MSPESEILALHARVDFLYRHLGVTYVENKSLGDVRVIDVLKRGNKIEAIKTM